LKRGDPATIGDRVYRIDRVVLHPDWRGESDIRVDIALVHLAEPVTGIVPAHLYTDANEVGLVATFVGRGGNGTGLTGPVEEDLQLRAATNRVESLVFDGSVLRFRFDAPTTQTSQSSRESAVPATAAGQPFWSARACCTLLALAWVRTHGPQTVDADTTACSSSTHASRPSLVGYALCFRAADSPGP
jgi:hypothetical protein